MKKIKNKSGFTIIELLVAIALIGILFSIFTLAIDQFREKANIESTLSYLATMKAQSERYYSNYNRFSQSSASSVCYDEDLGFGGISKAGLLVRLMEASQSSKINLGNEIGGSWDTLTCHARSTYGVDSWVVEVPTANSKEDSPEMYCIDSTLPAYIIKKNLLIPGLLSGTVGFSCVDSE